MLRVHGDPVPRPRPATSPSRTQARWAASIRNMVEHGQTRGSSETTVLSGVSLSSRLTRWISVPTPITDPAGASATARMMKSVEPTRSAASTTSWEHSGWTTTMPSGCSARKASTWAGGKRWWTEQCPFHRSRVADLRVGVVEAAPVETGVPHGHVVGAVAELEAGVAAQVLVGEEQDLVAPAVTRGLVPEGPGEHGPGVGRRAHHATVATDEGLQGGRRVHVGDRDHPIDVGDPGQGVPRLLHRVDVGHVGHGAAGVQVGQDDLLVVAGEDVGRLGHEVDAAEDDELGLRLVGGDPGQPERVAPGIRPRHHLVALVVVAEDDHPGAEVGLGRRRSIGANSSGCAVV